MGGGGGRGGGGGGGGREGGGRGRPPPPMPPKKPPIPKTCNARARDRKATPRRVLTRGIVAPALVVIHTGSPRNAGLLGNDALQQRDRIDVDGPSARELIGDVEGWIRSADDDLPAEVPPHASEEAGGGPDQLPGISGGEEARGDPGRQSFGFGAGFLIGGVAVEQAGQSLERGVTELAPVADFGLVEGLVVVAGGSRDGVVIGVEGLQDHPTAEQPAPGSPRPLREHLKGTFRGTEIRQVQAGVGRYDAHKGYQREIKAFGDHLSADEDGEVGFDALGARAEVTDPLAAAGGAGAGWLPSIAAVVAKELLASGMVGEGCIAACTLQGAAAVAAEDVGGRTAPVEKEHGLLARLEGLAQCLLKGAAEQGSIAGAQLLPHVDNLDRGEVDGFGLALCRSIASTDLQPGGLAGEPLAMAEDPLGQHQ